MSLSLSLFILRFRVPFHHYVTAVLSAVIDEIKAREKENNGRSVCEAVGRWFEYNYFKSIANARAQLICVLIRRLVKLIGDTFKIPAETQNA